MGIKFKVNIRIINSKITIQKIVALPGRITTMWKKRINKVGAHSKNSIYERFL
ncbi:hypothetical protein BH11BAC4_BH11BAC4_15930 [soil metagenome]